MTFTTLRYDEGEAAYRLQRANAALAAELERTREERDMLARRFAEHVHRQNGLQYPPRRPGAG